MVVYSETASSQNAQRLQDCQQWLYIQHDTNHCVYTHSYAADAQHSSDLSHTCIHFIVYITSSTSSAYLVHRAFALQKRTPAKHLSKDTAYTPHINLFTIVRRVTQQLWSTVPSAKCQYRHTVNTQMSVRHAALTSGPSASILIRAQSKCLLPLIWCCGATEIFSAYKLLLSVCTRASVQHALIHYNVYTYVAQLSQ
jgi:hypothetical protein